MGNADWLTHGPTFKAASAWVRRRFSGDRQDDNTSSRVVAPAMSTPSPAPPSILIRLVPDTIVQQMSQQRRLAEVCAAHQWPSSLVSGLRNRLVAICVQVYLPLKLLHTQKRHFDHLAQRDECSTCVRPACVVVHPCLPQALPQGLHGSEAEGQGLQLSLVLPAGAT